MNYVKRSVLLAVSFGFLGSAFAQNTAPKGWHLKDRATDGYYGISLDKAYQVVKDKKSKTVVVAIIDSGIDTTHEDLRPILWTNPKEIPGNGIDDDGNGYVDDVHGWNFLGGRDGRNVKEDSYEASRVYHKYKAQFQNIKDPSTLSPEQKGMYAMWKKAGKDLEVEPESAMNVMLIKNAYRSALAGDSILVKKLNKAEYNGADVESYVASDEEGKAAKKKVMILYQGLGIDMDRSNKEVLTEIGDYISGEERKSDALLKAPQDYRGDIVKDNYNDINDRFYGNNDIMAGTPFHGTHVAGIIGAVRNNGLGIDGIANDVRIMMIRAVPDGDEHDKDVALAIRYAADNGARIINMSFGKGFSPEKKWVDDAVRYAASKGVLLVQAAGNSAQDIDTTDNFPTAVFKDDGKRASNYITVGASGDPKNGGLVASFSNYGKNKVDVFAPGVQIYSSIPGGNKYGNADGTSMASPVVAGLAAFILSYYPDLTPQQLKYVIEKSAGKTPEKVINPETKKPVPFTELSATGGLVNAYEAIKLAGTITTDKKVEFTKPKTTIKKSKKS
ncbi:MAG: S8 family peptidase [Chitinophagaceae bacterium]